MNNPELMFVLLLGAVLMTNIIAIQMKWYNISAWKSVVISVMLIVTGLFGSRLWFFVENGHFRGRSFYGVIFIAPIVFYAVAKILKVPYGYAMDFCAPAGCMTLAMVKIQCLRDGCCTGKVLYVDENYDYVKFPSQLTEMAAFLLIAVILFCMSRKEKNRNRIFPWFLLLYGGSRFGLNFLRGGLEHYALGLSAGSFWSVIAFCGGAVTLLLMLLREKKYNKNGAKV